MRRTRKIGVAPLLERVSSRSGAPLGTDPNLPARRARYMGAFLVLAAAGLIARLWYLQVAHADDYTQMAQANHTRLLREPAPRGLIIDAHGRTLASNRSEYAIFARPSVAGDALTLRRLAGLLNTTPSAIAQTIVGLKRNDYDLIRIAIDVPIALVLQIEEQRPYLPGISTAPEPLRWYPNGSLLGNTLGTMGRIDPQDIKTLGASQDYLPSDFIGKTGLEAQYERDLRGTPGGVKVAVNAQGKLMQQVGEQQPLPGRTVQLTIDRHVEAAAERVFRAHAWSGGAAAVNPQTGAVIALASSPSINPNVFASGVKAAAWKSLNANPQHPMLNRAVDALYPPGSTFKQVVAAAGLQSGAITTGTTAFCDGVLDIHGAKFHCWQRHGEVDFFKAIAVSCDIFFYQAGLKIGPDTLASYARQYPLARHTGIDLPHEMIGSIPSPDWKARRFQRLGTGYSQWFTGDTLNMAIGQGYVLVTPLQMALVTATTANGGEVMRPYLVQRVFEAGSHQPLRVTSKVVLRRVGISPQNLEAVRQGMRDCVIKGTGRSINFPQVATAAKTGSAQVRGQAKTHGWFVAFAPYDHPTIACAAIVERGGHGADSAGKVVKAMLQAYFGLKESQTANVKSD